MYASTSSNKSPLKFFLLVFVLTIPLLGLPLPVGVDIPFLKIAVISVAIFIAAAGEEVGYMGYAVDTIQKRWGALTAAITMGLVWAIWHYPSIIQQGHNLIWIVWGTLGTVGVLMFTIQ